MSSLSQSAILQFGRGLIASTLGLPYDVYRLDAGVIGSIVSGDPDLTGFMCKMDRDQTRDAEASTFELIVFDARCDNTMLQLGDVLVGTDPRDRGTYVYAQYRQTDPSLMVSCEKRATIFRPRDGATTTAAPAAAIPGAPYVSSVLNASDVSTRDVLTLAAGTYQFLPNAPQFAAQVPIGIQVTARAGGPRPDSIPSSTTTARYIGYVPPLGVTLEPNDVLVVDEDHEYEITSAFEGENGFVGTIVVLEQTGQ